MPLSPAAILLFLFAQILYHSCGREALRADSDMDHTKYITQTAVSQSRCLQLKKRGKKENDSRLQKSTRRQKKKKKNDST